MHGSPCVPRNVSWIPFLALALALAAPWCRPLAEAGGPKTVVEAAPVDAAAVTPAPASEWETAFVMPGWLTGIDGTMGLKGVQTGVEAGFDEISKNLDMLGAGSLEVRRHKLGFILEGLYLKGSVGGTSPGPLLADVSVSVEQVIAEGTLTYRFFETDRAWLEFLAGARYIYMGGELTLNVDPAAVREASDQLAGAVLDRATAAARREVAARLPGLIQPLQDKAADLKAGATDAIRDRVSDRVEGVKEAIRDAIDGGIGAPGQGAGIRGPGIGEGISRSGPIRDAIRDYVRAQVDAEIEAARAKASAAVAQARARVRREVEARLKRAEARLAKAIEREINGRLPDSPVAASKAWVDPFVGFRGQFQLWENWHLVGRGDIGGFGVSSELTWNVYGALGVQLNDRTTAELGYRYLHIDYRSGGFLYDMAIKGPYLGLRIEF